ncbi:hypothetical protein [Nostoc sp. NMS4]|nr:hypothetical protein [Nostoc sp. NMS4]MBN3925138.1 hypothetical protein [Nostoc sp. NMS4]
MTNDYFHRLKLLAPITSRQPIPSLRDATRMVIFSTERCAIANAELIYS